MKKIFKTSTTNKTFGFGKRIAYLSKKIALFGLLALVLGKMQVCYDLIKMVKPLQAEVQFYYGFLFGFAILMVINIVTSAIAFVCKLFSVPNEIVED